MKFFIIIIILVMALGIRLKHSIDFGKTKGGTDWYVVNDAVMGGLSDSKINFTKNSMVFSGEVSLDNNGGFASVRSATKKMDLSNYKTVTIRFKSPNLNRIFSLRLNTNNIYYRPSYNQKFLSISNDWQEITFDLVGFKESILGKETGKLIPKEKLKKIIRLGIMLNDKKEGPFFIEIDKIIFQ